MGRMWQTISSRNVLKNKWFKIRHDRYIMPDRKDGDYFFVSTRGSSVIVPVTDQGRLIMVKQYRYLLKRVSVEFPMGGIEKGQTPLKSAISELSQETGYKAKELVKIGSFNPFIGITDEICHVYIARGLELSAKHEDPSEKIKVVTYTMRQVNTMIKNNKMLCGQSIAAWHLAEQYLK